MVAQEVEEERVVTVDREISSFSFLSFLFLSFFFSLKDPSTDSLFKQVVAREDEEEVHIRGRVCFSSPILSFSVCSGSNKTENQKQKHTHRVT